MIIEPRRNLNHRPSDFEPSVDRKFTTATYFLRPAVFCATQIQVNELEFLVVRRPRRGQIVPNDITMPAQLSSFTLESLRAGKIDYRHLASTDVDSMKVQPEVDSFVVMATLESLDRRSLPRTVYVDVRRSNSHQPRLVNLAVLQVITGKRRMRVWPHFAQALAFAVDLSVVCRTRE